MAVATMWEMVTLVDLLERKGLRLRPGSCPTTNALRIMPLEELPVPEARSH